MIVEHSDTLPTAPMCLSQPSLERDIPRRLHGPAAAAPWPPWHGAALLADTKENRFHSSFHCSQREHQRRRKPKSIHSGQLASSNPHSATSAPAA